MFIVLYRTLSLSRIYVYKTMLITIYFFLHVVLVVLGKQLTIFSWKSLPKNMHNYHKRSRYNEKKKSQSFSRTKKSNNIICINHWKICIMSWMIFVLSLFLDYICQLINICLIHYTYAYPLCHLLKHFTLRFLSLHVFGFNIFDLVPNANRWTL